MARLPVIRCGEGPGWFAARLNSYPASLRQELGWRWD